MSKRWLLANCFVILVKKGLLQEVDFKLHIKMINCCGKYTLEWCERGCGWPGCICIHEVAETSLRVLISYSRAEFARIKDRFGLHASIRFKGSTDQMGGKKRRLNGVKPDRRPIREQLFAQFWVEHHIWLRDFCQKKMWGYVRQLEVIVHAPCIQ